MDIQSLEDIPIILHTCDLYSKYWDYWWHFTSKYINHKNILFVSENEKPSFSNKVKCILTGKGEWGYRILKALDLIDVNYIFYMQEDMWAFKRFPFEQNHVDLMLSNNMDCLKIHSNCNEYSMSIASNNLYRFNQNSLYTMSHQVSLWRKDFFVSAIKPNEDPWTNEMKGSFRINNKQHKIYFIDHTWYNPVVRKNILQEIGKDMLKNEGITQV
jgi:hypothetical protein